MSVIDEKEYIAAVDKRIVAQFSGKELSERLYAEIHRFESADRALAEWAASDGKGKRPCPYDHFQIAIVLNALFARLPKTEAA